jgi:hypothetical protein
VAQLPAVTVDADESVDALTLPPGIGRLNRPVRAVVALVELAAAAGLVVLAFWLWHQAAAPIDTVLDDGTDLRSTRYFGSWMAGAIAVGTVAALLVLDALRQLVLAGRARPRKPRPEPSDGESS